jgi:tetratricopeptide (TPR) repeat protein
LRDQGNDGFRIYSRFAWCYAGLGEKEAAVKAAQHAVDLAGNDAIVRPPCEFELACIQARVGESEQAIATLARLLKTPGGATHGELRFEPNFDPLRENPLFKELLEEK